MRLALIMVLLLTLSACSENDAERAQTAAPAGPQTTSPAAALEPAAAQVPPPTVLDPAQETIREDGLKIVTHARGNGAQAINGANVAVHYTGWLLDDSADDGKGKKFDSSLDRGEPIVFPLGKGRVIRGWDAGIENMRVGGRRTLTIPPELAYGPRGRPPVIPPDAVLIFDVELVGAD